MREAGSYAFVTAYAEPLPIAIFLAMCDCPFADAGQLKLMEDRMLRPDGNVSREEVRRWYADNLRPVIHARRCSDGHSILRVYAHASVDGKALTEDEVIDFSTVLLFAGPDTVVNFLCFATHFLVAYEEHRRVLVADHRRIRQATEDLLRRFPS